MNRADAVAVIFGQYEAFGDTAQTHIGAIAPTPRAQTCPGTTSPQDTRYCTIQQATVVALVRPAGHRACCVAISRGVVYSGPECACRIEGQQAEPTGAHLNVGCARALVVVCRCSK